MLIGRMPMGLSPFSHIFSLVHCSPQQHLIALFLLIPWVFFVSFCKLFLYGRCIIHNACSHPIPCHWRSHFGFGYSTRSACVYVQCTKYVGTFTMQTRITRPCAPSILFSFQATNKTSYSRFTVTKKAILNGQNNSIEYDVSEQQSTHKHTHTQKNR